MPTEQEAQRPLGPKKKNQSSSPPLTLTLPAPVQVAVQGHRVHARPLVQQRHIRQAAPTPTRTAAAPRSASAGGQPQAQQQLGAQLVGLRKRLLRGRGLQVLACAWEW